jgi:hypothetical protein
MRKDASGVSEYAKHTRKRTGLRRRVNKGVRAAAKRVIRKATS